MPASSNLTEIIRLNAKCPPGFPRPQKQTFNRRPSRIVAESRFEIIKKNQVGEKISSSTVPLIHPSVIPISKFLVRLLCLRFPVTRPMLEPASISITHRH